MCLKYCSQYLPMSAIISVRRFLKAYSVCNKTVLCFSLLLIFVRLFGYSVKKTFFVAFYVSVPIVRPAAVSSWNSPKKKTKQNKRNKTKRKTVTWIELIEDKQYRKQCFLFRYFAQKMKKSGKNLKKSRFKEISPAGLICLILESKINCFNIYTVALNCYNQAFSSVLTF